MDVFEIYHGKKDQEKDGRCKNVHPDRIQIADPASQHVFP